MTGALRALLAHDGVGIRLVPGLFVDRAGRLCDSPFPAAAPEDTGPARGTWVTGCAGFGGAVGVRIRDGAGARDIDVGPGTTWATYLGGPDTGTPGTSYPYSTATRGVIVDGAPLLVDVYSGARELRGS